MISLVMRSHEDAFEDSVHIAGNGRYRKIIHARNGRFGREVAGAKVEVFFLSFFLSLGKMKLSTQYLTWLFFF